MKKFVGWTSGLILLAIFGYTIGGTAGIVGVALIGAVALVFFLLFAFIGLCANAFARSATDIVADELDKRNKKGY